MYPTGVNNYTDGAWDKKMGTIKDVFQYGDGREIIGSVGIVITLSGINWREYGVRTITINDGAFLALTSVFPLELLGAVVAIKWQRQSTALPAESSQTAKAFKKL